MAISYGNAHLTGLTLLEPFPDSAFTQVHEPRGSILVDASWSQRKWPNELRSAVKRDEDAMDNGVQDKAQRPKSAVRTSSPIPLRRPASAAHSLPERGYQIRPNSATTAHHKRPGTAPSGGRGRPTSASGKQWTGNDQHIGRGPIFDTKSAKELREHYIARQANNAVLNPKFLKVRPGFEEGSLNLNQANSETSTEAGGDEDDNDRYDTDDSDVDDEDRLKRAVIRINKLSAALDTATTVADALKIETDAQSEEIANFNERLADYEEQFEFYKEGDDRWREKNSALRDLQAQDRLNLEQARMNRCDLEDRTRPLDLKMSVARKVLRRWAMTFDSLNEWHLVQHRTAELSAMWQAWCTEVQMSALTKASSNTGGETIIDNTGELRAQKRRIAELEEEIAPLRDQLAVAEAEIDRLRATHAYMGAKLVHIAFCGRSDIDIMKIAFSSWTSATPILRLERQYGQLMRLNDTLIQNYTDVQDELAAVRKAAQEDTRLQQAREQLAAAADCEGMLQADIKATCQRSSIRLERIQAQELAHDSEMRAVREQLRAVQASVAAEIAKVEEAWQRRHTKSEKEHALVQRQLRAECDELEARVDDLLEALYPEGASGDGRGSRAPRVVPRSRGVLCAGCLTQILYRDVGPITSAGEFLGATPQRLQLDRAVCFEKTVGGPDPLDPAHTFLWQRRRDPSGGILEVYPESDGDDAPPASDLGSVSRPGSALHPLRRGCATPSRPQSAGGGKRRLSGGSRAEALRGEVAGFRNLWRG